MVLKPGLTILVLKKISIKIDAAITELAFESDTSRSPNETTKTPKFKVFSKIINIKNKT